MAFIASNFARSSVESTNNNILDIAQSPLTVYSYKNLADTTAAISASGYFNYFAQNAVSASNPRKLLLIGDWIQASASDGGSVLRVTAVSPNVTVSTDVVPAGSIVNADVAATAAIDLSKLEPMVSGTIMVGSSAAVATEVAMSGDVAIIASGATTIQALAVETGMIAANAVTAAKLSVSIPQTISVDMTAAEVNGAYAAAKLLLAAPGAGTYYVVSGVQYEFDYGAAQFAAGGVAGVQYDSTVNGAGLLTHLGVAAAVVNGVASDFIVGATGFEIAALVGGAAASIVAKGLYFSNKTQAFTTGDSDVRVHITYSTVTTSL